MSELDHEAGYWQGYHEGRDEAETRDLSFDELTDRAKAAEAKVARVEALADEWESHGARSVYESAVGLGQIIHDALNGGRP